jgi:cholesterol oxidase
LTATAEHFDAVVVGSGFGGSVTAYRLADAGQSVCLLERGKPFPPNSFPRSPLGMKTQFWDPSGGGHGMFNMWSFDNIDAICASGLGGGSLIYANVLLRKDEDWFVKEERGKGSWKDGYEYWPVTRADLDPHYERVERMMNVQKYPLDQAPFDKTLKVLAFRDAARKLGLDWNLVNLAVTFANDGDPAMVGEPIKEDRPNYHGRTRLTCKLTGECDLGCNHGSKNSLDYTYITAAMHAGADIRPRHEVRGFEPREGGGYSLQYVIHEAEAEGVETDTSKLPKHTMTCDRLILSAGTLGTTYLLLKNRAAFPHLSPMLGHRFSGNGDLLTFARHCMKEVDGKKVPNVLDTAHAPVITSAIRVADEVDGGEGRGFYLEDAGQPEFVSWMLQLLDAPRSVFNLIPNLPKLAGNFLSHKDTDIADEVVDVLGDCAESAGFLPLLGMGRDIPEGVMRLENGGLQLDWKKNGGSKAYFERVRDVSKSVAEEIGGVFLDNPIWLLSRVVTVHALGGAPMGRDEREGVVDPYGRVYNYPGLHIADGSVMPGPVGPNPSLTIAGLADRFADAILEDMKGPTVTAPPTPADEPSTPPATDAPASEHPASVEFTEKMRGFITFGEDDYDKGFRQGKKSKTTCMFRLTITMDDIERFVAEPAHQGTAAGYLDCDALGGKLPVKQGWFNLFVDADEDGDERKLMKYRLWIEDGEGHPITFNGFKEVKDDPGFDVWSDTTTLFSHVLAGHVPPGPADEVGDAGEDIIATGILHVLPPDFAVQMTTFRVDPAYRVDALARFGALFLGSLWETFKRGGKDD